jgi:PhnB protein
MVNRQDKSASGCFGPVAVVAVIYGEYAGACAGRTSPSPGSRQANLNLKEIPMSQTVTPYLTVSNAAAAIDFYKKAFGAEEVVRHLAPDGKRLMHAHLKLLGMDLMLSDDFAEHMGRSRTPEAFGGSPVTLHLHTDDVDTLWANALAAGAKVTMPLKDQFWGDRYGQFTDPFGHSWSAGQTIKKVSQEELEVGAKAAF